jgi:hypothetical protein
MSGLGSAVMTAFWLSPIAAGTWTAFRQRPVWKREQLQRRIAELERELGIG